jgi:hypothetical protein
MDTVSTVTPDEIESRYAAEQENRNREAFEPIQARLFPAFEDLLHEANQVAKTLWICNNKAPG